MFVSLCEYTKTTDVYTWKGKYYGMWNIFQLKKKKAASWLTKIKDQVWNPVKDQENKPTL